MARAYLFGTVVMALAFGGLASAQTAVPAGAPVACPHAAAPPVLDGHLDEWSPLPQAVMATAEDWRPAASQFAEYGGPKDISADLRFLWDNRALYLAVETRDDALVRVRSASQIDQGDSLVISFAGEAPEQLNQFVVALLRGASLVWRAQPSGRAGEAKTVGRGIWARPEEGGGWRVTYELTFPWSELAPLRPIPGQEFTLTISVCDDDGKGIEGCLEHPVTVVLSAAGGSPVAGGERPAALAPKFAKPEVARFDRRAFVLNQAPVLPFGGLVDYARLPKESWADRLALLKRAGLNTIAVTVPWSHHQPTANRPDFSDLEEFLHLAQQSGLPLLLNLGPYAGDDWEAGGIPGWAVTLGAEGRHAAVDSWYQALLPMVKRYQLAAGGPIAAVVIRPIPEASGAVTAESLQVLIELVQGGGIEVPMLTANAPAARDNSKQSLANLLDTLALYTPASVSDVLAKLGALASQENGPASLWALPGDYGTPEAARRSAALTVAALAAGSTAVVLSDFAPGPRASRDYALGNTTAAGIVDPAGGYRSGFAEVRLVGQFVRLFGADLARAVAGEGLVKADDPGVRTVARVGEKGGYIFLWDEQGSAAHQVRLTYTQPGTAAMLSIPAAGAIALPAGCAKVLATGIPVARGVLEYATSEIAGLHQVGDRTLLVVYGDLDTPGEIALRWPGPPLVLGEVTRQQWDPEKSTLTLDYYHTQKDQYVLVDDLEILILSRERAESAAEIAGPSGAVTLSGGAGIATGAVDATGMEAALECAAGTTQVSAALPKAPAEVTVDGKPALFAFATPSRVLTFAVETPSFEDDTRATGIYRLSHAILGGPPKLTSNFGQVWFLGDSAARGGAWRPGRALGGAPEAMGLTAGSFARLRSTFEAAGSARLRIAGSTDPALVFINGKLASELSGTAPEREADVAALLTPGANQIEIVLDVIPRASGYAGVWTANQLPEVSLVGGQGSTPIANWEVCPELAGEADGWTKVDLDVSRWHLLRLGPWRAQGREPSAVAGVGWYRVPFGLPRPEAWRVSYYVNLTLHGSTVLYVNGSRLAGCRGDGSYRVPLSAPPVLEGEESVLAAAVYGLAPGTGLDKLQIAGDREAMTRRHTISIKFQ